MDAAKQKEFVKLMDNRDTTVFKKMTLTATLVTSSPFFSRSSKGI